MSENPVRPRETIKQAEDDARVSTGETETRRTRRHFLGALGSGVATTVAVPRTAGAQETPTISMGSDYFDPIGFAVEPGTTVRFEVDHDDAVDALVQQPETGTQPDPDDDEPEPGVATVNYQIFCDGKACSTSNGKP